MNAVFSRPLYWCTTTTAGRITLGIGVALGTILTTGAILGLIFGGVGTIGVTLLFLGAAASFGLPAIVWIILPKKPLLHDAACRNDTKKINKFLNLGSDINCRDAEGNTPLHLTARWGSTEGTKHLISKMADVNAVNGKGQTPLHVAISLATPAIAAGRRPADCWFQTVNMLIKAEADLTMKDGNGKTSLDLARDRGDEIFEILLMRKRITFI